MAVAYDSLTIIDLLDTATYIYYAEDELGSGWSSEPSSASKYIGIYSGPPFNYEPNKVPMDDWGTAWSGWLKYVGEKGEKGDGIKSIEFFYMLSESGESHPKEDDENWSSNMPSEIPAGVFLWVKTIFLQDDGTKRLSYSVSYQGENGEGGAKYRINTSHLNIIQIYNPTTDSFSLTPNKLTFSIMQNENEEIPLQNVEQIQLSISNLKEEMKSYTLSGEGEEITSNAVDGQIKRDYYTSTNYKIELDFSKMFAFARQFGDTITQNENLNKELAFIRALEKSQSVLRIAALLEVNGEKFWIYSVLQVQYNLDESMAKLSLEAAGIYASIANTKLNFDERGLSVYDGALTIYDTIYEQATVASKEDFEKGIYYLSDGKGGYIKAEEYNKEATYYSYKELPVFYADDQGNLTLIANFESASGNFKGNINALSGTIGGFTIENGKLVSDKKDENNIPFVTLNGEEGSIHAKNLVIGEGAVIQDYISLGDYVKILNPNDSRSEFISVVDDKGNQTIKITQDGKISLGNDKILLSGSDQSIKGFYEDGAFAWSLEPDLATFQNISVTGSIKASTFEYGTISAIGGILFLRPSSKIAKIETTEKSNEKWIYFEEVQEEGTFKKENICLLGQGLAKTYCKIIGTKKEENNDTSKNIIAIHIDNAAKITNEYIGSPIIDLGQKGDIGIGINGSSNGSFLTSNSISVVEFNGQQILTPKIILGKLPEGKEFNFPAFLSDTYGLYAENAWLKGSLVTGSDEGTYCGIGTLFENNNIPQSKDGKDILLWAGAKSSEKKDIEEAVFYVDRAGNMRATKGYFSGMISSAKIEASEIKTAIITGSGSGSDGDPALTITDADKGIVFYGVNEVKPIFSVETNGVNINTQTIVDGALNITGDVNGNSFVTKDGLKITQGYIQYNTDSKIDFQKNSITQQINNKKILEASDELVAVWGNIQCKDRADNVRYEYKQALNGENIIGYDIYVYE